MLIKKLITYLALVIDLLVPSLLCEGALNSKNNITVIEPVKGAIWMSGQHSYPIIWTQSKFCFKWNIELLDHEERKIAQISTGLSEFKEGSMRHAWLVPPTIQNGDYLIKICENSAPETCGRSSSFFIRTTKENVIFMIEIGTADFDAFSPIQTPQMKETLSFSGNATKKGKFTGKRRLPHELRRQKRMERERLYFKRMSERIRHDTGNIRCTIERVHRPSKETFVKRFMKPRKPAILTGVMDDWEAMKSWTFDTLGKDD
ncbi:Lysine-specific demethylase 8, partial [Stylophora pistillata]